MPRQAVKASKAGAKKSTKSRKRPLKVVKSREQVILDRLAISHSEYRNVYWIGRKAMRLTFLSQQQRALNLVWALNKMGKLGSKTRVTVVGAGLAGMTAAFAANQLGASVTLLEARQVPLHLQLGCWLRFVHPHILNWPQPGSDNPLTDLPCLNWGADMAARVCNTVLEQWSAVEKTVKTYYGYEVRRINMLEGYKPMIFAEGAIAGENASEEIKRSDDGKGLLEDQRKADDRRGNYEEACDCLILSVGFGLEKPLPSVPFLSYWENDNFGRPLITGPIPRRYLVTGCGDGGLIDAIRLSLNAFDHADFVYSLSNMEGLEKTKDALLQIDECIVRTLRNDPEIQAKVQQRIKDAQDRSKPDAFDEARTKKRIEIDIQGELLEEKYRNLDIPLQLKELITKRLRQDTIVYLNSPSTSPMSLGASILNRFVVFLLRKYGFLRYRAGEVDVLPTRSGQPLRVLFHHEQFPQEELEIHELVVRHGPVPAIDRLFPARIVADARLSPDDFEDPTREPQYTRSDNFLKFPLLLQQRERVYQNYALASTPLAAKKFFTLGSFDRFGIEVAQGKVSYVRRPTAGHVEGAQAASYFGIDVRSDPPAATATKTRPRIVQVDLVAGVGIANSGQRSKPSSKRDSLKEIFGTLGCFVRMKDGKKGLLTTAGALGGPHMKLKDQIVLAVDDPSKKSKPIAALADYRLPNPSSPLSSVATGTVEYNQFQAAIAVLEPGAHPQAGFGKAYPKAPQLKYDHSSGEESLSVVDAKVFKVGAKTGLTRGTITNALMSVEMHAWGDLYWYENLFSVSSINSKPFAQNGDGGALVIRDDDGTILGMIIGGDEQITFVCPIRPVFTAFECQPILSNAEFNAAG